VFLFSLREILLLFIFTPLVSLKKSKIISQIEENVERDKTLLGAEIDNSQQLATRFSSFDGLLVASIAGIK
jgi:hypothetical protein